MFLVFQNSPAAKAWCLGQAALRPRPTREVACNKPERTLESHDESVEVVKRGTLFPSSNKLQLGLSRGNFTEPWAVFQAGYEFIAALHCIRLSGAAAGPEEKNALQVIKDNSVYELPYKDNAFQKELVCSRPIL